MKNIQHLNTSVTEDTYVLPSNQNRYQQSNPEYKQSLINKTQTLLIQTNCQCQAGTHTGQFNP